MERREIRGNVVSTTLSGALSNTATSFSTETLGSDTFPSGSTNPFVIVINRGQENEEKILVSSRSGTTFTVKERGYDDVPASEHLAGSVVDHVLDATSLQDMNRATYDGQILQWMGV
jgi:hypothetical protein